MKVVTRFPPSPTGLMHIGSLRTALYNYLFARQHKGRFIVRIEDTDRARFVAGATENIIETLKWAGLQYDEGPDIGGPHGPYVQSQRTDLYRKFADLLLEQGHAYRCFCTPERLEEMRKHQQERKLAPKYDRKCLGLAREEVAKLIAAKTPFVVRQKIPSAGAVEWHDVIRGDVSFAADTIDDQVLMKSDGFPTYHLANVVDDHHMEVTHVIRGEEWLSSSPKHILLYRALAWNVPTFAHLPLLLNKDRSKLSKRQGDVAVDDYRRKGYLPEAVINFIALLGWHPGGDDTQEVFTLDELVQKFSLEKVHKAGAVFDLEKLDWLNWQWRKRKFDEMPGSREEKLRQLAAAHVPVTWTAEAEFFGRCLVTVEEKIMKNPADAQQHLSFYFKEKIGVDEELLCNPKMKVDRETARRSLAAARKKLTKFEEYESQEAIQKVLLEQVAELGIKNGQLLWPVRVALTGEQFSPGVFEVIWAFGKKRTLERLDSALAML